MKPFNVSAAFIKRKQEKNGNIDSWLYVYNEFDGVLSLDARTVWPDKSDSITLIDLDVEDVRKLKDACESFLNGVNE